MSPELPKESYDVPTGQDEESAPTEEQLEEEAAHDLDEDEDEDEDELEEDEGEEEEEDRGDRVDPT